MDKLLAITTEANDAITKYGTDHATLTDPLERALAGMNFPDIVAVKTAYEQVYVQGSVYFNHLARQLNAVTQAYGRFNDAIDQAMIKPIIDALNTTIATTWPAPRTVVTNETEAKNAVYAALDALDLFTGFAPNGTTTIDGVEVTVVFGVYEGNTQGAKGVAAVPDDPGPAADAIPPGPGTAGKLPFSIKATYRSTTVESQTRTLILEAVKGEDAD